MGDCIYKLSATFVSQDLIQPRNILCHDQHLDGFINLEEIASVTERNMHHTFLLMSRLHVFFSISVVVIEIITLRF